MILLLYLLCGIAALYQLAALIAAVKHVLAREKPPTRFPKVSILKPVHGRDDAFFEAALRSHTQIDYPDYELLFGVGGMDDEAVPFVRRLSATVYVRKDHTSNAKAGTLIELSRHAKGEIIVVNDADIRVTPDYLQRIVAPLEDSRTGLVTCLYRPVPDGIPAMWESLGIAVDFAPSTLVAPLVGINEFGLGSTLCFRAEDLREIGGFAAVADYLADDYQLARRITTQLGKRSVMSTRIVDTGIGYKRWSEMWSHQVRWARTIRVSRGDGYLGLPVTHAGVWVALALLCGLPMVAAGLAVLRMLTGFVAGFVLLRCPQALALPLIPVWDIWAFGAWIAGLRGDSIVWRGRRQRLSPDGRLLD
ncbi:MAG: glycosyltransferase [Candidatus Solibacter usitatus]|nr:glycosyltransferase [Candidatus Solibacter usitatus]